MPDARPELAGTALVLLGSFNPSIFQPAWFVRQNLLTAEEAEGPAAKVKVIHPQVSQFETESYAVQVTAERFAAISKPNTPGVLLRDLVLGTFYVLEHTPVRALGINRLMHFRMPSEAAWHQLGDRLAPKDAWREILGNEVQSGRPGMLTLEIVATRHDAPEIPMRVKVQPSGKVKPYGVYFETNEHYAAPDADGLRALLETLRERFEDAERYAERIANHIMDWAGGRPLE